MLELANVTAGYGKIDVLRDVSLDVAERSIVGILGPNGAGKSTLARTISRLTRITAGDMRLNGESMREVAPDAIVRNGIVHVPQGRMLFSEMTAAENLELGAYLPHARKDFTRNLERVEHYFPILHERRSQAAGLLSGGEQQMLAIARALMSNPRLLLLDEPSLGLAPRLIAEIYQVIREINKEGVSILLAEQNPHMVMQCATAIYVIENGRIAFSGTPTELANDPRILQTYLGIAADDLVHTT